MPPKPDYPTNRSLKVYAFDPTKGRYLGNFMTIGVPYEKNLEAGPIGKYLAVIDYDGSNSLYYPPVDLNHPAILAQGGLDPTESDPWFHQQMVYAVASATIHCFEFALGRKIRWRPDLSRKTTPHHGKLRILPHAMQGANAFYDPKLRALLFGYFPATETDSGANLPGQIVFTCLSHDIIAHETTHALMDGLRRHFMEATSVDTPAFHEAFADIVALFQHFSFRDALMDTIQRTGGAIQRLKIEPAAGGGQGVPLVQAELTMDNPLVELAKQFGEAMGNRAALRSALGTPPGSVDLTVLTEPHARGSILVAAVFDAFFSLYLTRTRDLMRIARAGGALPNAVDLHPDLANRLAGEAAKTAKHIQNICIRALDYCPPVDITFGDFLRALITADLELVPDDPYGYRPAIIGAFRSRGIRPDGAASYSEDALRWNAPPEAKSHSELQNAFRKVIESMGGIGDDTEDQDQRAIRKAAVLLHQALATRDRQDLFLSKDPARKVQVQSFRRIQRVGPDGQHRTELVVELMQKKDGVLIDPKNAAMGTFTMRGGTTLILSAEGKIRYSVSKNVDSEVRLERQRQYYQRLAAESALAPYMPFSLAEATSFRAIHRGY